MFHLCLPYDTGTVKKFDHFNNKKFMTLNTLPFV